MASSTRGGNTPHSEASVRVAVVICALLFAGSAQAFICLFAGADKPPRYRTVGMAPYPAWPAPAPRYDLLPSIMPQPAPISRTQHRRKPRLPMYEGQIWRPVD